MHVEAALRQSGPGQHRTGDPTPVAKQKVRLSVEPPRYRARQHDQRQHGHDTQPAPHAFGSLGAIAPPLGKIQEPRKRTHRMPNPRIKPVRPADRGIERQRDQRHRVSHVATPPPIAEDPPPPAPRSAAAPAHRQRDGPEFRSPPGAGRWLGLRVSRPCGTSGQAPVAIRPCRARTASSAAARSTRAIRVAAIQARSA